MGREGSVRVSSFSAENTPSNCTHPLLTNKSLSNLWPAGFSILIVAFFFLRPPLPTHISAISPNSTTPLHPSLSLPRACLSGSVPVCLFADDSTWSRCDAQQLLLYSLTLPSALWLPPALCLPSNVSLMHLSTCCFSPLSAFGEVSFGVFSLVC